MDHQTDTSKVLCDIIVVTRNKLELTQRLVKSWLSQTQTPSRLIIVDNGSGDGTREYLSSLSDTEGHKITVIMNNENKGFIHAVNQGLQVADAAYICFCHNDTIFTRRWLEEIILTFKEYPGVGLLNPNSNALGAAPKKGEAIDDYADRLKRTYSKGAFVDMPFCIGFCLAARRAVIDQIGGFDERFAPMFFEDTDYSRQVAHAGYRLGVAKRAYVWHHDKGSADELGNGQKELFERSRAKYLQKWGKTLNIAWVAPSYESLLKALPQAVECGRDANFITFWVKGLDKERRAIFREADVHEFSDIKFISYKKNTQVFWKALTKKKKYDLVIAPETKLRRFLKLFGVTAAPLYDPALIKDLKFRGLPKP